MSKRRVKGQTRAKDLRVAQQLKTQANALLATPEPSGVITPSLVRWSYCTAWVPLAIGYLMYFVESSDREKSRFTDPIATVGQFVEAQCLTSRKRRSYQSPHSMQVTLRFDALNLHDAPAVQAEATTQSYQAFTGRSFRSRAECEAALPAVRAAKAAHPVWYERRNPHAARTVLDLGSSTHYLWLGLAGIPLLLYARVLHLLERQAHAERAALLNVMGSCDAYRPPEQLRFLYWPLRLVKFTQKQSVRNAFVYLVFVFLICGYIGQYIWEYQQEREGEERARAAAGQTAR